MTTHHISPQGLAALVQELVESGNRVIAPARATDGGVDYRGITSLSEAFLDEAMPRRSLKECFLPATECLFKWRRSNGVITVEESSTCFTPCVVLGARPCDAAGVEVLDAVMGWDYRDDHWFGRREATTIISLACDGKRETCFCEELGLGPQSTQGADLLLIATENGHAVEVASPRGQTLVEAHPACFSPLTKGNAPPQAAADGVTPLPLAAMSRWLGGHFEDAFWEDLALRCHGCGACASVCPTCHCFDIVDEPESVDHGCRRRNWDTCQTGVFTLHASGHNPRGNQHARFRQRLLHKFHIYPHKFGQTLCSGCGRCVRSCPAGIDLPEMLQRLAVLATGQTAGETAA